MKQLIRTKGTEFEQNEGDLAIIDTNFRAGKPIMLNSKDLDMAILNGQQDALDKIEVDTSLNVYIQDDEPATKNGLWLKHTQMSYKDIVITDKVFIAGEWLVNNEYGTLPEGFENPRYIKVGDYVYILGDRSYKTRCYKYNIKEGTFSKLPDCPSTSNMIHCVAEYENIIYVFDSKTCFTYNILTNTYDTLETPPGTMGSTNNYSGASIGPDIYLFGGTSNKETYKYNVLSKTYTQLSNYPSSYTQYITTAVVGDTIYLINGKDSSAGKGPMYKYNTVTDTFSKVACNYSGTTTYRGCAMVIGTTIHHFNCDHGDYTIIDTASETAQLVHYMPNYDRYIIMFLDDNKIYKMGGNYNKKNIDVLPLVESTFDNDSIILTQNETMSSYFGTELINISGIVGQMKYKFNDVFHYSKESGINKALTTYYGNGNEWIKFK